MIYQIYDIMMSISAFLDIYFEPQLVTRPIIDINKCNNFQEYFEEFLGLGLSFKPFSI